MGKKTFTCIEFAIGLSFSIISVFMLYKTSSFYCYIFPMTFKKLFPLSSPLDEKCLPWRQPGAKPRLFTPGVPSNVHGCPILTPSRTSFTLVPKRGHFSTQDLSWAIVTGLQGASSFHLPPYQADGESGRCLPSCRLALYQMVPKATEPSLTPEGWAPSPGAQVASLATPFPSSLPSSFGSPWGFRTSFSCICPCCVFYLFIFQCSLSIHFSPSDHLAPSSVFVPPHFSHWAWLQLTSPKRVPWGERSAVLSTCVIVLFPYQTLLVTCV